jgi:hypothetical protein
MFPRATRSVVSAWRIKRLIRRPLDDSRLDRSSIGADASNRWRAINGLRNHPRRGLKNCATASSTIISAKAESICVSGLWIPALPVNLYLCAYDNTVHPSQTGPSWQLRSLGPFIF